MKKAYFVHAITPIGTFSIAMDNVALPGRHDTCLNTGIDDQTRQLVTYIKYITQKTDMYLTLTFK